MRIEKISFVENVFGGSHNESLKKFSLNIQIMDKLFGLVSIQPILQTHDTEKQWFYYESLINRYLGQSPRKDITTFVTLPEYALGNKSAYDESELEKIQDVISTFATEHHLTILAGSHADKENQTWYNRAWLFDSETVKVHNYENNQLFNFELKNEITPGTNNGVFTVENLKVKLLICSDLWFPEEIRSLNHEQIDLLLVPAMAVVQGKNLIDYGKFLWHSLAQTRSKENVIPLVVSDWAEQPMREAYTCGSSCIIDPSRRWENEVEKKLSFNFMKEINEGFIASELSQQAIQKYQKYRREVGLLPEIT